MHRLRPLKSLVHDAVDATTHLIQEGHDATAEVVLTAVSAAPGLKAPVEAVDGVRDAGTRAVLATVRGVNRLVETVTDAALDLAPAAAAPATGVPLNEQALFTGAGAADQLVGVLNGAVGDHLAARGNGLDLGMRLRHRDRWLGDDHAGPADASGDIVVLVHGLSTTETSWCFGATRALGAEDAHFGALLQRDLELTPLFARYNTGLPVARNGAALAAALGRMLARWSVPVTSLTLVGHSMGGLVCRSAARESGLHRDVLRHLVCIGSPHQGAPLARFGHAAADVLQRVPHPATRVIGKLVDGRSAGVKDLASEEAIAAGPLREDLDHLFIAGSLAARHGHPVDDLLGDMLVPVASAHGPAGAAARQNVWTRRFGGVGHHQLQVDARVYAAMRGWLGERFTG